MTLNLYAYVDNNPMTGIDADGHFMTLAQERASWGGGGMGQASIDQGMIDPTTADLATIAQINSENAQADGVNAFYAYYHGAGQAQQQYGRQTDGSYKADPAKVQAAIDAGKPIHEPGNPDQKSECVFACKFLAQMKNIGTGQWRKGRAAAGLNDTTDIGLAIATLGSGRYPSQHGNSGIYMGHDANGGIKIVDQWPNNGPDYNHPFEHTLTRHDQGPAMDPSAYFVVMVPKP